MSLSVSVIIPTFHRGELLCRALHSVQKQTLRAHEILVVDDGSSDWCDPRVRAVADSTTKFIVVDTNRGAGDARNAGVQAAQCAVVAFLDSDDEWLPGKLERQVELLVSASDGTVIYGAVTKDYGSSRRIKPLRPKRDSEPVGDYLFVESGLMQTSTLSMRRQTALRCPFTPGLRRHQDYDLCLRLEAAGATFDFIAELDVVWHVEPRQDRISQSHESDECLRWIALRRDLMSVRARSHLMARHVAIHLAREGRVDEAERVFHEALESGTLDSQEAEALKGAMRSAVTKSLSAPPHSRRSLHL